MGFFRRQPPGNNPPDQLSQHAINVQNILISIGADPSRARMELEHGYGWSFQYGSALIEVYLTQLNDREYLQVLSPIMHVPAGGLLPLYRHLLELNLKRPNASFGIHLDVVYVFNERPLEGMDGNEAKFIIEQITRYADELDNQLVTEFGGRLYTQP